MKKNKKNIKMTKEIDIRDVGKYLKALHCSIRWDIIEILRNGPKSSEVIFNLLTEKVNTTKEQDDQECEGICLQGKGRDIQKPTLYYHLRELESVKIIESTLKKKKGAPEKVWKLNIKKLAINL